MRKLVRFRTAPGFVRRGPQTDAIFAKATGCTLNGVMVPMDHARALFGADKSYRMVRDDEGNAHFGHENGTEPHRLTLEVPR